MIDVALHTETNDLMVYYRQVKPNAKNPNSLSFVRPLTMFYEQVLDDKNVSIPRFTFIEETNKDSVAQWRQA